jgi:hypothetical protein
MFGKKVKTGIASFAAAAALTAFAATDASATHFRYGTMNWTVDGSDATGRTVNFTFTEGWRVSDSITYNLGDGTTFNTSSNRTTIGNFTDANGEAYSVFSSTLTKTYASNSVFNLAGSNCCRISTLQNGNNDQWFNLTASVDLTAANAGNTGSPVAQAPVIVPMPITTSGTTTSFQLPFADPDNDSVTVSVAPAGTGSNSTTSGLSTALPTAGGNTLSVSSTGLLEWDTSGATAGQKYALQLEVDENGSDNRITLDFIIEISNDAANQAPFVNGDVLSLEVGDPLSYTVTGGDPDNGPDPLTWTLNNITGPQTLNIADYSFDTNTQLLSWDTTGYATGIYTFFVSNFDGAANGLGSIVVNLTQPQVAEVPEPAMAALLGLGLVGFAAMRRRTKKA